MNSESLDTVPGLGLARSRTSAFALGLAVLVLLGSCGVAHPSARENQNKLVPAGPLVSKLVDAAGGSLELTAGPARGAKIVIPPGAMAKPARITMQASSTSASELPPGIVSAGPMVIFGPEGQTFAKPVTITLPTTRIARKVHTRPRDAHTWTEERYARNESSDSVAAYVTHFSVKVPTVHEWPSDRTRWDLEDMISSGCLPTRGGFNMKAEVTTRYGSTVYEPMKNMKVIKAGYTAPPNELYIAVYEALVYEEKREDRDQEAQNGRFRTGSELSNHDRFVETLNDTNYPVFNSIYRSESGIWKLFEDCGPLHSATAFSALPNVEKVAVACYGQSKRDKNIADFAKCIRVSDLEDPNVNDADCHDMFGNPPHLDPASSQPPEPFAMSEMSLSEQEAQDLQAKNIKVIPVNRIRTAESTDLFHWKGTGSLHHYSQHHNFQPSIFETKNYEYIVASMETGDGATRLAIDLYGSAYELKYRKVPLARTVSRIVGGCAEGTPVITGCSDNEDGGYSCNVYYHYLEQSPPFPAICKGADRLAQGIVTKIPGLHELRWQSLGPLYLPKEQPMNNAILHHYTDQKNQDSVNISYGSHVNVNLGYLKYDSTFSILGVSGPNSDGQQLYFPFLYDHETHNADLLHIPTGCSYDDKGAIIYSVGNDPNKHGEMSESIEPTFVLDTTYQNNPTLVAGMYIHGVADNVHAAPGEEGQWFYWTNHWKDPAACTSRGCDFRCGDYKDECGTLLHCDGCQGDLVCSRGLNFCNKVSTTLLSDGNGLFIHDDNKSPLGDFLHGVIKLGCPADEELKGVASLNQLTRAVCTNEGLGRMWNGDPNDRVIEETTETPPERREHIIPGFPDRDWSPGATKFECPLRKFVNGVTIRASGALGILCLGASSQYEISDTAEVVTFNDTDNRLSQTGGDFAPYIFKGQCAKNQVLVGLSAMWGVFRRTSAVSILCSNVNLH